MNIVVTWLTGAFTLVFGGLIVTLFLIFLFSEECAEAREVVFGIIVVAIMVVGFINAIIGLPLFLGHAILHY